jgi:N-acetylglutamate synthase-like GNAT family acetyltransferase
VNQELASDAIRTSYNFLKGLYIEDTADSGSGFYSYSSTDYGDTNFLWNHAVMLHGVEDLDEEVADTEDFYEEKGKRPAFYLPELESLNGFLTELRNRDFEEVFKDAWMFYTGGKLPEGNSKAELREVSSKSQIEEFVDLFYKSHRADLDDPYAGLSEEYGKQLKEKFDEDFDRFRVQHFLVKLGDESVGHVTFVENGEMGIIYNLGTIPDLRGQGIATAALRKTVKKLEQLDIEMIFLQTEKGSENEDFFSNRGFETRFEARCLVPETE